MPIQTTYSAKQGAAFEGQRVDFRLVDLNSKVAEGSDIAFGRAVVAGTLANQAKLPSAVVDRIEGITNETTAWLVQNDGDHLYEEYREMNLMTYGPIWVYAEATAAKGDPVYFRFASGSETVIGRFRNDDDSGTCQKLKNAVWEDAVTAGALGKIHIDGLDTELTPSETITALTSTISLLTELSIFDTTLGASTATLADGSEGQVKKLVMTVDGGDQVVTPANLTGGTTITFADVGDAVTLQFISGSWVIISNAGALVA